MRRTEKSLNELIGSRKMFFRANGRKAKKERKKML